MRIEGLSGQADSDVWHAAQTTDSDLRKFSPGTHHGLMLVRLRVPGRLALAERIADVFRDGATQSLASYFVLLTDHKLRVHRPAP